MKKIWAILLMSTAAPAVAASVYECSGKNGQTTYTQNPSGSHCRPANLGAPSIYSAAPAPAWRSAVCGQRSVRQRAGRTHHQTTHRLISDARSASATA